MSEAKKYTKKPVTIEAVIWDGSADTANRFIGESFGVDWWYLSQGSNSIVIPTLKGNHTGNIGDYIIKGVAGEFYPCRADIFALTYEPATEQPHPTQERDNANER